jgi:hypothetical protein
MAPSSKNVKKIPLISSNITVSSGSGADKMLDEDFASFWTSAASRPHWIQLTLPTKTHMGEFQIYLKDYGDYSPLDVKLHAGDSASTLQEVKSMQLPFGNTGWLTILTAKEARAVIKKPTTVVKLEIISNHKGGGNSKVTSLRVMTAPSSLSRFKVGDRVTLTKTYTANGGDGWCLGTTTEPRVGVVTGVVPSMNSRHKAESLLIAPPGHLEQLFVFKPSWVLKIPNDGGTIFRQGDRVQLDASNWSADNVETAGKCLGKPADRRYGIVRGVGAVRDGVQRNVEVAVGDADSFVLSLYPSYSLIHAVRSLVSFPEDYHDLLSAATGLIRKSRSSTTLSAARLVELFGPEVKKL